MSSEEIEVKPETEQPVKSKKQLRREQKAIERREYWKRHRKEVKERKREAKRMRIENGEPAVVHSHPEGWQDKRKRKGKFWKEVDEYKISPAATVVIDMQFADKMTEKETKSSINQLGYVYSVNGTHFDQVSELSEKSSEPLCDCAKKNSTLDFTGKDVVAMRCQECLPSYFDVVVTVCFHSHHSFIIQSSLFIIEF